jgi:hypothetical protein
MTEPLPFHFLALGLLGLLLVALILSWQIGRIGIRFETWASNLTGIRKIVLMIASSTLLGAYPIYEISSSLINKTIRCAFRACSAHYSVITHPTEFWASFTWWLILGIPFLIGSIVGIYLLLKTILTKQA